MAGIMRGTVPFWGIVAGRVATRKCPIYEIGPSTYCRILGHSREWTEASSARTQRPVARLRESEAKAYPRVMLELGAVTSDGWERPPRWLRE